MQTVKKEKEPFLSPASARAATQGHKAKQAFEINRLPFLDLEEVCSKKSYSYAIVWRPQWTHSGDELRVDKLASHGEFAAACASLGYLKGESLPGRVFESKSEAFLPDIQDSSNPDDSRQELARKHGVRGVFALWRDGAVYEFGATWCFDEAVASADMSSFGGVSGLKGAANVVLAANRFKKFVGGTQTRAGLTTAAATGEGGGTDASPLARRLSQVGLRPGAAAAEPLNPSPLGKRAGDAAAASSPSGKRSSSRGGLRPGDNGAGPAA